MTWVRFDDSTTDHPKFASLEDYAPLAGWLWFSATCYCGRYLTDGKVDIVTLRRLWPYKHIGVATGGVGDGRGGMLAEFGEDPTVDDLVKLLVSARLFDEIEPGLYRVHDYLKYNPSKREVLERRRNMKKAGQAGGLAKARAFAKRDATQPAYSPTPNYKDKDVDSKPEDSFGDLDHHQKQAQARELLKQVTARIGRQPTTTPDQPEPPF